MENSVKTITDEMDWSLTTNVATSVISTTTKRKTKWISQKVINEKKKLVLSAASSAIKWEIAVFF